MTTTHPAAAQAPAGDDPSRLERRFEEPRPPQVEPEPLLPAPEPGAPPPGSEDIRFVLTGIEIEGSNTYATSDFMPLWSARVGTEITLADAYALADAVTARYAEDGYLLVRAVIPPQRIQAGVLRILVIEGVIDRLRIEGEANPNDPLLRAYVAPVLGQRPPTTAAFERALLLANDLPGLAVRAILEPVEDSPGAAALVLTATRRPLVFDLTFDNHGTRGSGPHQYGLGLGLNGVLGLHEGTRLRAIRAGSNELTYLAALHEQPLGGSGLRLRLSASRSQGRPGYTLRVLDGESRGHAFTAGLTHPLVRRRAFSLYLEGGIEVRSGTSRTLARVTSEERSRKGVLALRAEIADAHGGISTVEGALHQGVDAFGTTPRGSDRASRELARPAFGKLTLGASRDQDLSPWLSPGMSLLARAEGQLSGHNLPAGEEFGIGGRQIGRGYDPSAIVGDHGYGGALELRWTGDVGLPLRPLLQPYLFIDGGRVVQKTPLAGERRSDDLVSAGFGLRLYAREGITASAELAKPLTRPVASRSPNEADEPRLFFSIGLTF